MDTVRIDEYAAKAATAVGVTPHSDMRPFVEQAVKYALTAALSDQERAVEVKLKPLEWDDDLGEDEQTAFPLFGQYYLRREPDGRFGLRLNYACGADMFQTFIGPFDAMEAAKAAAQADYEQRIRSALVDVPVEPVGEVGEMPGSNGGFTMAVFKSSDVPLGTKLYTRPPHRGEDSAEVVTLTRAEADRIAQRLEFDASWDKCGDGYYSIKRQLGTIAATHSASATSPAGGDHVE